MQRKGMKFVWSIECETNFQKLKHLSTNALVLKITDLEKYFLVCIDVCKEGLGGVLMQEGHVIFYGSRKFNEHEQQHVTHDLELASIVNVLKMWRHYRLGRRFVLMKYHCGLNYMFD
jgi:hypothetical protein